MQGVCSFPNPKKASSSAPLLGVGEARCHSLEGLGPRPLGPGVSSDKSRVIAAACSLGLTSVLSSV